jgi:hypothetical protein
VIAILVAVVTVTLTEGIYKARASTAVASSYDEAQRLQSDHAIIDADALVRLSNWASVNG